MEWTLAPQDEFVFYDSEVHASDDNIDFSNKSHIEGHIQPYLLQYQGLPHSEVVRKLNATATDGSASKRIAEQSRAMLNKLAETSTWQRGGTWQPERNDMMMYGVKIINQENYTFHLVADFNGCFASSTASVNDECLPGFDGGSNRVSAKATKPGSIFEIRDKIERVDGHSVGNLSGDALKARVRQLCNSSRSKKLVIKLVRPVPAAFKKNVGIQWAQTPQWMLEVFAFGQQERQVIAESSGVEQTQLGNSFTMNTILTLKNFKPGESVFNMMSQYFGNDSTLERNDFGILRRKYEMQRAPPALIVYLSIFRQETIFDPRAQDYRFVASTLLSLIIRMVPQQ